MFCLVFISNDSRREDISSGTPFLVLGPMELKADCRELLRRNYPECDFRVVGSDEMGPILWHGTTVLRTHPIETRVHLVRSYKMVG